MLGEWELKSDLDTYMHSYYKLPEGFRLLNWTDWNFSDTPAFCKQTWKPKAKLWQKSAEISGRNCRSWKVLGGSIVRFVWGSYLKHPIDVHSETGILKLILQFLSLWILYKCSGIIYFSGQKLRPLLTMQLVLPCKQVRVLMLLRHKK